ncbi:hypothetical protein DFQ05_0728 [Winogradskyella wandonensis]|uniref:Uncharacterized protein n=1 Tax=Winogradskyella wandonensis TaxID=1442586 RepID=A0A4R1KVL6_9FLAO|nr:hypothetical protein [Winogradskyella wandonensis]TCK69208.1 hypothetical protein DFQ05_0728 [Winogradskyella wandonensis]
MSKESLIQKLNTQTELDIYYEYLLGQDVWYFQNNGDDFSSDYDAFKKFISKKINIPFNNISIVGSAKTRYSFSPSKELKEFHENSDFDLIIVSRRLFYDIWTAYRAIAQTQYLENYIKKCGNIFGGFISIRDNDKTYGNQTLENWQKKVLSFKAELQLTFNIQHDINYRIYSDWESVQEYHLKGITKLKNIINEIN